VTLPLPEDLNGRYEKMPLNIELSGDVSVDARRQLVPGAWYLGFDCQQCDAHIAVMEDPTNSGTTTVAGSSSLSIQCPICGGRRLYKAENMRPFEATAGGTFSPDKQF
jgi:DNA-directed RNA polymerase subunit RPC12/RpoP